MTALLAARIKAVAAFVAAAVVSYVATAIVNGDVWTAHGVEVAAATAVLTSLGVHRAPANKKRRKAKDAGHVDLVAVLLGAILAVLILIAIAVGAFR